MTAMLQSPPQSITTRVNAHIDDNADQIIEMLRTLLAFRTPSQDPSDTQFETDIRRCHKYLEATFAAWGLEQQSWLSTPMTFKEHPIRIATWKGSGGGKSFAMNGHVDVVPTGDTQQWSVDPWAGEQRDGKIFGRGACDMKGGVTAMLMAMRSLQQLGIQPKGDVITHIVSDEEVVGMGTRQIVQKAARPDFVLSTEPTSLAILPAAGGLEHFRIEFEGVEEHAGRRYASIYPQADEQGHGISAIDKARIVMDALESLERDWARTRKHPLFPPGFNTLLPGIVIGGPGGGKDGKLNLFSNPGTTPNYCSVEYNAWFYPGQTIDEVKAEIEATVNAAAQQDSWLQSHPPKITWALRNIRFPALDTDASHPLVQQLETISEQVGFHAPVRGFTAAADLSWYSQAGIPGVIFGPGDIANAHSPNEFVSIGELISATKAIALMILAWCGFEES